VEGQITPAAKSHREKAAHLMCGAAVWGVGGAVACADLAYLSFAHWRRQEFDWPHDLWFIVTCGVWILLMAGLIAETRCWRERIFFTLVLLNFVLGFTVAVWLEAPAGMVRELRIASAMLWHKTLAGKSHN
jgi:hypothetical protein